ncbi:MAG: phycobilisome rod-core linker polypeptide [Leptodesmis sp.]|uniref:phycobilisome rod-core linker polypeptide n=1 Tax=Leptodesmis sp. TaxID=3100501 RepID=UPI003D11CCA5
MMTQSIRSVMQSDPGLTWISGLGQENSEADFETIIRAVYRQVLGNAHVMESERLTVPESQFKQGRLSVREFVRQVAKSELYRSRFFDNCYRYRAIELNFKHLLGRAPATFDEMREHSAILDQAGYEAEIDSYLDSDEYQQAFGENGVPYYRGYSTQPEQSMLAFTNMLQLRWSISSSDKDLKSRNKPRLTRSLILNRAYGIEQTRSASDILAEVFKPSAPAQSAAPSDLPAFVSDSTLEQQYQKQAAVIANLQKQLAQLSPFASMGAAITRQGQFNTAATVETPANLSFGSTTQGGYRSLQQQVNEQTAQIASLQKQVAEARALASISEARLNRWRQRTF